MQPQLSASGESAADLRFRRIANWLVVVGTAGFSGHFFLFLAWHMWMGGEDGWVVTANKEHFAATIGLPLASIAALCLVIMLKFATGPIEFEGLGFKFRGASGPIVLWVLCFLAMAAAIRLLW